jgi:hypothetical protein
MLVLPMFLLQVLYLDLIYLYQAANPTIKE